MTELKCGLCGAQSLPGTSFCRQCGAAIAAGNETPSSEQPTAHFPDTESATTQRLDPRATRPTVAPPGSAMPRKSIVAGVVLIVVVLGIISAVAIVRMRNHSPAVTDASLLYPGAQTVVDMTNQDGSRTIQLQTSDPLERVESWYHNHLTLNKTVRLTSTSVVLKNEKVTVTLAVEDNKTNILIKQLP